MIFALGRVFYGIFLRQTIKKLAEFIRHKENFRNFVLGEHSDYCLYYFSSLGTIKVQQFSLITKFIDSYISSNSRSFRWVYSKVPDRISFFIQKADTKIAHARTIDDSTPKDVTTFL